MSVYKVWDFTIHLVQDYTMSSTAVYWMLVGALVTALVAAMLMQQQRQPKDASQRRMKSVGRPAPPPRKSSFYRGSRSAWNVRFGGRDRIWRV